MRIDKVLCSLALLALTGASYPNPATVDPDNDFDCATLFQFFHKMAEAKQAPADLLEEVLIMNAWFGAKWDHEHPGEEAKQLDHYLAMVKAVGDDPKAYKDTLNACSTRANADPAFSVFVTELRKSAPPKP